MVGILWEKSPLKNLLKECTSTAASLLYFLFATSKRTGEGFKPTKTEFNPLAMQSNSLKVNHSFVMDIYMEPGT